MDKPKFYKKHYIAFAKIFAQKGTDSITINDVCKMFKEDNSSFNTTKFILASQPYRWKGKPSTKNLSWMHQDGLD